MTMKLDRFPINGFKLTRASMMYRCVNCGKLVILINRYFSNFSVVMRIATYYVEFIGPI